MSPETTKKLTTIADVLEQLSLLRTENDALKEQLEGQQVMIGLADGIIEGMKAQVAWLEDGIKQLTADRDSLKEQVGRLEAEGQVMRSLIDLIVQALDTEPTKIMSALESLDADRDRLATEVERLTTRIMSNKELAQAEVFRLTAELEQAKSERDLEYKSLLDKHDDLKAELEGVMAERNASQQTVVKFREALKEASWYFAARNLGRTGNELGKRLSALLSTIPDDTREETPGGIDMGFTVLHSSNPESAGETCSKCGGPPTFTDKAGGKWCTKHWQQDVFIAALPNDTKGGENKVRAAGARLLPIIEAIRQVDDVAKRAAEGGEKEQWFILHPGTGQPQECDSFEHAMAKWHEGYNLPWRVLNGVKEPFEDSNQRVTDYYRRPSKQETGGEKETTSDSEIWRLLGKVAAERGHIPTTEQIKCPRCDSRDLAGLSENRLGCNHCQYAWLPLDNGSDDLEE